MILKKLFIFVCLCSSFSFSQYKVVGYYTGGAQNRPGGGRYLPEDIDGKHLTHAIYAFAGFSKSGKVFANDDQDIAIGKAPGMYQRFNNIKKKFPKLKTLLSFGGEHATGFLGSDLEANFADVLASKQALKALAKNMIDFAIKYGFDGVDIDWEANSSQRKSDKNIKKLLEFIKQIRSYLQQTKRSDFLITVVGGIPTIAGLEHKDLVVQLMNEIDWLNVIGYDFHGGWDKYTGANAPLYKDRATKSFYIDNVIQQYKKMGIDSKKLVLGVPAYGRSRSKVEGLDKSTLPGNVATGLGRKGRYVQAKGILSYLEIKDLVNSGKLTMGWDSVTSTAYAYNLKTKEWVSFDSIKSIKIKMDYIKKQKLGGGMLWALPLDDFRSNRSILKTMWQGLN